MNKKKKYYVVWEGYQPGIYDNWEECKKQIIGFKGAKYKSFSSLELANNAFYHNEKNLLPLSVPTSGIAVDAAFSSKTQIMEYRGVWLPNGKELFHVGPFKDATNNVGEFLAIVHALALCNKNNWTYDIYTDSNTALVWIQSKKARTKLQPTENNIYLFELIGRAEKWLNENTYTNRVLKWDTQNWGENPADFGRK